LLALAEALEAPIATSLGARGLVPTRHRLSAGVVGSYSAPPANRIVCGATLVLFVGCHTGDQVTLTWTVPRPGTDIIQIDIDPFELGRNYPDTLGLMGDPKAPLAELVAAIGKPARSRSFADRCAAMVAEWRAAMAMSFGSDDEPVPRLQDRAGRRNAPACKGGRCRSIQPRSACHSRRKSQGYTRYRRRYS
jgi:acetolactate synthase I/II/III large subunit